MRASRSAVLVERHADAPWTRKSGAPAGTNSPRAERARGGSPRVAFRDELLVADPCDDTGLGRAHDRGYRSLSEASAGPLSG